MTEKRTITLSSSKNPKFDIYKSENAKTHKVEWRWRILMSSDIVAASTEGYIKREDCVDNILKLEEHIKYLREKDMIK